jgi:hypothetical protein
VFQSFPAGQKIYILEDGYVRFPTVRQEWRVEEDGGVEVVEQREVPVVVAE